MALDPIVTASEVAAYLRLPLTTVYKLAGKGVLLAFKVGKHWRFRREDIEAITTSRNKPGETAQNSGEKDS